jgi:hypothetical protein
MSLSVLYQSRRSPVFKSLNFREDYPPGPVPAAPVFARIIALHRVLAAPAAHARRLARALDRLKQKGERTPVCAPMASAYRLRPELGLVASLLPGMVMAALGIWPGPEPGTDTS